MELTRQITPPTKIANFASFKAHYIYISMYASIYNTMLATFNAS